MNEQHYRDMADFLHGTNGNDTGSAFSSMGLAVHKAQNSAPQFDSPMLPKVNNIEIQNMQCQESEVKNNGSVTTIAIIIAAIGLIIYFL